MINFDSPVLSMNRFFQLRATRHWRNLVNWFVAKFGNAFNPIQMSIIYAVRLVAIKTPSYDIVDFRYMAVKWPLLGLRIATKTIFFISSGLEASFFELASHHDALVGR